MVLSSITFQKPDSYRGIKRSFLEHALWIVVLYYILRHGHRSSDGCTDRLSEVGIRMISSSSVRSKVTEGTRPSSVTSGAIMDKVAKIMRGFKFEVIASNLNKEQKKSCESSLQKNEWFLSTIKRSR